MQSHQSFLLKVMVEDLFEGHKQIFNVIKKIRKILDAIKSKDDMEASSKNLKFYIGYLRDILIFHFHYEENYGLLKKLSCLADDCEDQSKALCRDHFLLIKGIDEIYETNIKAGIARLDQYHCLKKQFNHFVEILKQHEQIENKLAKDCLERLNDKT